jgi:hypothetical protein
MKGRRLHLLLLAIGFAALVVVTALFPPPTAPLFPTPTGTVVVPFYRLFPDMAVLDIAAIRLRSPETERVFTIARNAEGVWQAITPSGTLAEEAGSALARTISLLPYTSVSEAGAALSTYGFTPEGILSVEIVLVDGSGHGVAIGYRTPTATGYYALVDDDPMLYILDRAPIDYLISLLRNPPIA